MNEAMRIELARETDAADLARFVTNLGLSVKQDRTELTIGNSPDETVGAIESWLAESGAPLVPTVVGERELALRPQSD